jgi:hypothetical protein
VVAFLHEQVSAEKKSKIDIAELVGTAGGWRIRWKKFLRTREREGIRRSGIFSIRIKDRVRGSGEEDDEWYGQENAQSSLPATGFSADR